MPENNLDEKAVNTSRNYKTISFYVLLSAFHLILFSSSLYLTWGWITLSDIKQACEEQSIDYDDALMNLVRSPYSYEIDRKDTNDEKHTNIVMNATEGDAQFDRLAVGSLSQTVGKDGVLLHVEYFNYLTPFIQMSDNMLNFCFCIGVGYIFSFTILLIKCLKAKTISKLYFALRPISGSLVSGCLFLFILAGGSIIWEKTESINGLSVGAIAAIGSLYCERFERFLSKGLISEQIHVDEQQ